MSFSERELLMLSNYAYFNCSVENGTIEDTLNTLKNENGEFDKNKILNQGAVSINMTEDEAKGFLEQLDADERLKKLHVARNIDEGGIRGICYSTENEKEACVIFRGTGGTYGAWNDNLQGEYLSDTSMQKLAKDFVQYECGTFENLYVSGHSKGGNLAQYTTIMCGAQIAKCVSFDGQGFGKEFLKEHKEEVEKSKNKITSVSAYNDYVNILLTPVAASRIFVNNNGVREDGHSSMTLLNSLEFNEDGSIKNSSKTAQGLVAKFLESSTDMAVDVIDMLPNDGGKLVTDLLAATVASILSDEKSEEFEKNEIEKASKNVRSYVTSLMGLITKDIEYVKITHELNSASIDGMKNAVTSIMYARDKVKTINSNIARQRKRLNYDLSNKNVVLESIKRVENSNERTIEKISKFISTIEGIVALYERCEMNVADSCKECG